jgi:hypothetical protein
VEIGVCPYQSAGTNIDPEEMLSYHWQRRASWMYNFFAPLRAAECGFWHLRRPTYDWKISAAPAAE